MLTSQYYSILVSDECIAVRQSCTLQGGVPNISSTQLIQNNIECKLQLKNKNWKSSCMWTVKMKKINSLIGNEEVVDL